MLSKIRVTIALLIIITLVLSTDLSLRVVELVRATSVQNSSLPPAKAYCDPLMSLGVIKNSGKHTEDEKVSNKTLPQLPAKSKPTSPAVSDSHLLLLFEQYGTAYGVNPNLLSIIAHCESGFNTNAVNGPYAGLFQFQSSTWISNRLAMGEHADPFLRFDPEESVKTAAFKIARDGVGAWPVCGKQAMQG